MSDYQLLIIGAGPGGYVAALHAAKRGLRTAVIENREVGGTCLNRGCIPTKTLLHSSEIVAGINGGEKFGVGAERVHFDMSAIFARKREVSAKLSGGIEGMFRAAKVDLLRGTGTVTGSGTVKFVGEEGEKVITAERILLATGSVPARPPIPGLDLPGVLTSDELLEGCDHLYDSLVIIGGGVIGVEFATFYADLGCKVTIIEGLDRLLPNMDRELGQNLSMILKKHGVDVYTNSLVANVEQDGDALKVNFTNKDKALSVSGEAVLCAIGRRPYTEGLFADGVGVEMNGRSIRVDENYETSLPGVYAIGDVSSKIQLAHVASAQGTDCVERMVGGKGMTDLSAVPSCIYCVPEIACVGITADEAKAAGREVVSGKYVMFSNGKTVIRDGDRAFMKVVADKATHVIVGAQFMCEHATDMISEMATAIVNGLTVEQMLKVLRPHPTFEEGVHDALEDVLAKLNK
ncbi:MAG: dihydrolipoyl dehydrogenase [Oscillospiraceae bacterium]|nr:dihydrolipoyl dehydrogenase [Oscillospiraceae bacterium]MDY5736070.1 dihydrolipoyl dehydrogenase [Oscillospiraceae bacterium]